MSEHETTNEVWREYGRLMARAVGSAADQHLYDMQHGWDETRPRTLLQRLFRRPATVVHHKGFAEFAPVASSPENHQEGEA